MREILFRGKERSGVLNHQWVHGALDNSDEENPNIIYLDRFGNKCIVGVLPETVGQYTRLNDKNSKKIFEGDILSVTVQEKTVECGIHKFTGEKIKAVWTVEYKERHSQGYGFYAYGVNRRFNLQLTRSVVFNVSPEVIGNIHDNPELLK